MANWLFVGIGSLLLGLGAFDQLAAFQAVRRVQDIKNAATSLSQLSSSGWVKIRLRVEGENTLQAPFSKTRCLYFRTRLQAFEYGAHNKWTWTTKEELAESRPFYLTDGSNRILVDLNSAKATVDVPTSFSTTESKPFRACWGPPKKSGESSNGASSTAMH